jgi:hypothetical protein
MIKRLDLLINSVRLETNNADQNSGITDNEIVSYFNDAQKLIQSLIFQNNASASFFIKNYTIDILIGTQEYTLPTDVYATNAIQRVEVVYSDSTIKFLPMFKMSHIENNRMIGWFLQDNKIIFSPSKTSGFQQVRVNYFKKLPEVDIRRGQITSLTATNIGLGTGFDTNIGNLAEYVTIVDAYGTIKQSGIYVSSFDPTGGNITTNTTLSGIAVGDYVVIGYLASSHCELPSECETYLKDYTKQRIYHSQSSTDKSSQAEFTGEQKTNIMSLFVEVTDSPTYVPVVDYSWGNLGY